MKQDCQTIADALLDYEGLAPAKRAVVDAHLAECPACRDEFELMKEVDSMFADLQPADVPAEFADSVMERICGERPTVAIPRSPVPVLCGILVVQFVLIRFRIAGLVTFWNTVVEFGRALFGDWIPGLVMSVVDPLVAAASALPRLAAATSVGPNTAIMIATAVLMGLALGLSTLRHVEPLFRFEARR